MKSIITLSAALILLASCSDTEIYFTKSQPEKKKALKTIPSKFHGSYKAPSDSTFLFYFNDTFNRRDEEVDLSQTDQKIEISENCILNKMKGKVRLSGDPNSTDWTRMSSNETIIDTLILSQFQRSSYSYTLLEKEQTQLIYEIDFCDTLFSISPINRLKKWKDKYFLNIEISEDKWSIFQINKASDKQLEFKNISEKDIQVLRRILKKNLEYSEDELVHISPKSFKEFIAFGGFEDSIRIELAE